MKIRIKKGENRIPQIAKIKNENLIPLRESLDYFQGKINSSRGMQNEIESLFIIY